MQKFTRIKRTDENMCNSATIKEFYGNNSRRIQLRMVPLSPETVDQIAVKGIFIPSKFQKQER